MDQPLIPEILDLVNANDEIVGEVEKSVANQNPHLIHREVGILLTTTDKQVLVQQRSFKKIHGPGQWQVTAAGHVTKGLTYEQAAHKELLEELGFDTKLTFYRKDFDTRATESRFNCLFIGRYTNEPITIQKSEVEQVRLISQAEFEIMKDQFGPGSKMLLEDYFNNKLSFT